MAARRALITGVTGQDGSYLADRLLFKGVEVIGAVRDASSAELAFPSVAFDLASTEVQPTELYHLASPTFVPDSWTDPASFMTAIVVGTASLLAAVRSSVPSCRVVVASSSEVFGDAGESPMRETTPMRPRTPYGVAKLSAHGLVGAMRRDGLHCSSAITFNHESPRRPVRFLPRKVTCGVAAIAAGRESVLTLGSLDAVRDWSDARDVVRGYELMALADEPEDYVLASGVGRTVSELVDAAFAAAGVEREGRVEVDPAFVRPPEAFPPVGDAARAAAGLGWRCEITFEQTIADMLAVDLEQLRAE